MTVDGSKFKAVNNRDKNFTPAKLRIRQQRVQASISRGRDRLARIKRGELVYPAAKVDWFKHRLEKLETELTQLQAWEEKLQETPDQQLSLTDPDARSMKSRGAGIVGYNVQLAVEPQNHFIVFHDVVNSGSDRGQLARMSLLARAFLQAGHLTVIADRGYYKGEEILFCEQAGITTVLPRAHTSNNEAEGYYSREAFQYLPEHNIYTCPAGEQLIWRYRTVFDERIQSAYWSSACPTCRFKSKCTQGKYRRIYRWEHEDLLDTVQARLDQAPETMTIRRSTVEHPFGTLKCWMGYTHFLCKGLKKVKTEMSLYVLAYNLKRAMNTLGVSELLKKLTLFYCLFISVLSLVKPCSTTSNQ